MNDFDSKKYCFKPVRENEIINHNSNEKYTKRVISDNILSNQTNNGNNLDKNKTTFTCLSCNYVFTRKSNYKRHLLKCKTDCGNTSSNVENNIGNNKEQNQYLNDNNKEQHEYRCNICNYVCYNKYNYNRHLLTKKHIDENIKYMNEINNKYICSLCNFQTVKKYNYNVHLQSKKHIAIYNKNNNITNANANAFANVEIFKNEVISTLMSQLSYVLEENNKSILAEQTKVMIESQTKLMDEQYKMNKMITDIANKPSNNIINNQINNQTKNQQFNMNVFLNETCKDAMNLSDFLENMHVSMEDMEKTGELGFAKGMSRIIMNNLNAIDVCKRPINCSDVKRETLYVKNNGVWEKETEERKRTKEIIYKVSCLNTKQLLKWRDLPRNKGYEKSDHKKHDEFTKLVMEINKLRDEEIDKVITAVSKHVAIDKDKIKMSGYLN